jgi:hypothetical protein
MKRGGGSMGTDGSIGEERYQRALELAVQAYDKDSDHSDVILPLAKQFADFLKDGTVPKDDADA